MNLLDTILNASDGKVVGQIAKQLGLPEGLAKQAAGALTPALARGIQRNADQSGGLDSLLGALGKGNHQRYVDEPEKLEEEDSINDGNAILGHILGSKDVSRNVAGAAAEKTGVDSDTLKKMLPMLGAAAMGALSKQTGGGGGSPLSALAGAAGGGGDPLSMITGLIDTDDDGPDADDLLNLAKKFF